MFRRLTKIMREHGWEPIRLKFNGIDGGGVTEPVRGYQRKTNRLPYPHISEQFPGKIDTTTPYVIGKVVSRLEMDSRWALARSVRALVAERDALKGKLESSEQVEIGKRLNNARANGRTLAVALTRLRPIRHAPCAAKSRE